MPLKILERVAPAVHDTESLGEPELRPAASRMYRHSQGAADHGAPAGKPQPTADRSATVHRLRYAADVHRRSEARG
jgi:hypothetical protein